MNQPESNPVSHRSQNLVIGGGIAGIVTALELLDGGQSVCLLDSDSADRFGGLAIWAFGGMALVDTPEQHRVGVKDSPQLALEDWIRFGELTPEDNWPRAWAECYVRESREMVYDWVKSLGLKFMPAVNWVERGSSIKGNSVARYHVLWGTGRELVETLIDRLRKHPHSSKLEVMHGHRATEVTFRDGVACGCRGINVADGRAFTVEAENTIVATGGINGSVKQVRRHWPDTWPKAPVLILNGANPLSDGSIHHQIAEHQGCLTHQQDMWNYAAGIPHPQPHFDGHGLSLIPCKSALWLTPDGDPVGPAPMVTGYDTNEMCRQVAEHPYTWHLVNWKIAIKELAISGAEHNPNIVDHRTFRFLKDLFFGNKKLVRQMLRESTEFIAANDISELAGKMNLLSQEGRIDAGKLQALVLEHDRAVADPAQHAAHPGISRVLQARQWRPDSLRTCNLQAIGDKGAGPLIAIRVHFVSRKSLGGLQTDLQGRVLSTRGVPMRGLYAVGEAAGFGGGGASGKRSLEGTFLSGCILTARKTAQAIRQAS